MAKRTAAGPGTGHEDYCICRDIESHIAAILGVKSEDAREHLRNARIELLKTVRSVIDARIERLSQSRQKGTKISVE